MLIKNILALVLIIISLSACGQDQPLFKIVNKGRVGYINKYGRVVIEPVFYNGMDFSEGLASVRSEGYYGFIDKTGQFILKPQYDYAESFINGIACVYKDGKPYFINKDGGVVLDTVYKSLRFISNNLAVVQTNTKKQGIINLTTKKLVADTVFNEITNFSNGAAMVKVREKGIDEDDYTFRYAVIDTFGRFVVPFDKYDEINEFADGYALVTMKDSENKSEHLDGLIDTKGKLLFQRSRKNHSYITESFHDGLAIINLYKYWIPEEKGTLSTSEKAYEGYLNLKGEIVFNDTLIRYLKPFSNRRAFIQTKERDYLMINKYFKPVGKDTFDNVLNDGFANGFAIVEKGYEWGIIDTNGIFIIKPSYDYIHEVGIIDSFFFYAYDDGDDKIYGVATLSGRRILKPIMNAFDRSGFKDGLLKAIVNNRLTYIDKNGNITWQEKQEMNADLDTLNIDFMNRGYFYAYSKRHKDDLGGFGSSDNASKSISPKDIFPINKISVLVDNKMTDTFENEYRAQKVYVVNATENNIEFNAQDSRLEMKVQAKSPSGQWNDIEYLPNSWCGNSYHILTLAKNRYWTFVTPDYRGAFKTKLRIELKYINPNEKVKKDGLRGEITIYSNEYDGSVNPGQFWNKRTYYPSGIMDPYLE